MSDPTVIAYLSSVYARASDSFIRNEVRMLRELGFTVHTFSVRQAPEGEIVSEDVRLERDQTEFLLSRDTAPHLAGAVVGALLQSPVQFVGCLVLALRCSAPGIRGRLRGVAYLAEACLLAKRLKAKAVQHLHNHIGEGSAAVAMLASRLSGIPYSLTIHGIYEFDRPQSLALDEKIARSAFTVTVSCFGLSQLLRWVRLQDWSKIKIVRCGVEDRFMVNPVPIPREPRVIFVGRLVTEKGLLPLVDAVRILSDEGHHFHLSVVGDGPLRSEIQRRIDQHGLGDKIEMLGWCGADEVMRAIQRSRAFVLPSFSENLPVSIMEALALHRPVISTYIGGIPELVREGECGWLVPATSVHDLARAMREALTMEPQELERMGREGAARVAREHNARTEAGKLAALIKAARTVEAPSVDPATIRGAPQPASPVSVDGQRNRPTG